MDDSLDELSYDLEEDGVLVRRTVEKKLLHRGPWSTLLFLYEELDRKTDTWRPAKIAVVRFQKLHGNYRKHSSFVLASDTEARELVAIVDGWLPRLSGDSSES